VKRITVSTIAVASILLGASAASAQNADVKSIVSEVNSANKLAQASQKTIDGIQNATDKLTGEFKQVLKVNAGLRAYNAQQRRVITRQEEEIRKIKITIGGIDEIKRQITPLMLDMINDLQEFIDGDIPFLLEERNARVAALREAMDNPNVSDPERFRVILAAYKAEVTYGSKIKSWIGDLEEGGKTRSVSFAQVGRIGYYYQTQDQSETKVWNVTAKKWDALDAEFTGRIKTFIRIAGGRTAPNIVTLPIAAPREKAK